MDREPSRETILDHLRITSGARLTFPRVYRSRYLRTLFLTVGRSPLRAGLAFFAVYWIIPLAAVLFPFNCTSISEPLACIRSRTSNYVSDDVHLIFSLLASTVAFLAYSFVLDLHIQVSNLATARKHSLPKTTVSTSYSRATSYQYHWFAVTGSIVAAGATLALFWDRIIDPSYITWWGNIQNGASGIIYAIIASLLTFLATQYLILLVGVSLFIVRFSTDYMQILPVCQDGMSGLRPGGTIVVRIWRQTAVLAVCLYLVFYSNYLNIAGHWAVWFFSFIATSALPFAALTPFVFIVKEASEQKRRLNASILRTTLGNKGSRLDADGLLKFFAAHEAVQKINILPIRGWRFLAIAAFNAIQLYVSADTIFRGFEN